MRKNLYWLMMELLVLSCIRSGCGGSSGGDVTIGGNNGTTQNQQQNDTPNVPDNPTAPNNPTSPDNPAIPDNPTVQDTPPRGVQHEWDVASRIGAWTHGCNWTLVWR